VFDGYLLIPYFIVRHNRCIINNKICMFLTRNKESYNTYNYIHPVQLFLTFVWMEVGNAKISSILRLYCLPTHLVQNSTTHSGSDRTGREQLSMLIQWTKNVHENKFYARKWLHDSYYIHSVVISINYYDTVVTK
jgi:hypothetical protein